MGRHRSSCPAEPVLVRLTDGDGLFVAEVIDVANDPANITHGAAHAAAVAPEPDLADHAEAEPEGVDALDEPLPDGIDLAVIGSLVDDVTVSTNAAGSVVRMTWPAPAEGSPATSGGQAAFGTSPPSA